MPYASEWSSKQFDKYVTDSAMMYMLHVTASRVIDEITDSDIDETLSQQYAQVYQTPWCHDEKIVEVFLSNNKSTVQRYLTNKIISTLEDAYCFIKRTLPRNLRSELTKRLAETPTNVPQVLATQADSYLEYCGCIRPIPLTASIVNQIELLTKSLEKLYESYSTMWTSGNPNMILNTIKNQEWIGDLDALRQMMNVYKNTVHIDKPLVNDGGGIYIPESLQTCLCKMARECIVRSNEYNFGNTNLALFFAKIANDLISTIFSCYIPYDQLNPLTEEEFYQRYVVKGSRSNLYNLVMPYIREYSGMNLGFVLKIPLMIDITRKDNSMKYTNTINESSLSERYLAYHVYHALCDPASVSNVPLVRGDKLQ